MSEEKDRKTTEDGQPATDDALLNKEQPVVDENTGERSSTQTNQLSTQHSELITKDMEVHHHSHAGHHKKKWNEYFWEFLMLFLAVFCGFLAENIREHVVENDRAKEFSKSLMQDLENDTVALNKQIKWATLYIAMADSLLELSKTTLEDSNATKFSFYTRFAYWTTPISWNRATFEQVKNSGSLRYFKNDQLLKKMLEYNAVVNDIEGESGANSNRGFSLLPLINSIIEPSLHRELSNYFLLTLDSMPVEIRNHLLSIKTASLENKRERIAEMLNMVVVQQRNLKLQINSRWLQAHVLATELINDLKKEYHTE